MSRYADTLPAELCETEEATTTEAYDQKDWAAVKEFRLTCHSPDTILCTIYSNYGNLHQVP